MDWAYIWFGLAMVEVVLILWLAAQAVRDAGWELAFDVAKDLSDCRARHIRKLDSALEAIAALDTPKAAHGVKKAVKIAREALK